ncbi:radical SAM family heme chaperone HemW [Marinagarivorans algicola]|uniref:radical SAM family heme chaperone HemW n=1 Tax=Marinagarivorans algicola TaxID=1513270 RepID=UPI000AE91073|nr:radical SAM family heme chaperone HemW [Marinagarivorans algicola]
MPTSTNTAPLPPLSLYVHIPWCVRKCPYCDFNSHTSEQSLPETQYVQALIADLTLEVQTHTVTHRPLHSIFFGGGTPSLFSAQAIGDIIDAAKNILGFANHIEITLEANPGTAEYTHFGALKHAGINRLSLGVQSFNDEHLHTLGRIHSSAEAFNAFKLARQAGIDNINLDLMHGLPNQTPLQATSDIRQAIALEPEHISWYQLTVEPNTVFYNAPPALPNDDALADIQDAGEALLAHHNFLQYEVSAYCQPGKQAKHNLNYWHFGDYLGIGAGAHSKLTHATGQITRHRKTRLPADYLANKHHAIGISPITPDRLPLEFMMNALRQPQGFETPLFQAMTGLPLTTIQPILHALSQQGLILHTPQFIRTTALGFRFLNTVLSAFDQSCLPAKTSNNSPENSAYNHIASDKTHL